MADGVFHLAAKLGKAKGVAIWDEEWIVAETALTAIRLGNSTTASALERPDFAGLAKRGQRQHTLKLRASIVAGHAGQRAQQLGVVGLVG